MNNTIRTQPARGLNGQELPLFVLVKLDAVAHAT